LVMDSLGRIFTVLFFVGPRTMEKPKSKTSSQRF
jgi:hypothetical protein